MESLSFSNLVLQPTSLCNVNCSYCYLAERRANSKMSLAVARRVAGSLEERNAQVRIIWHGGEPLSCGIAHFSSLISEFDELASRGLVSHTLQTNGTLITNEWCELFRNKGVAVSVSVDGPSWANGARVDWANKPIFEKILRGVSHLKSNGIPFTALSVIGPCSLARASEIYRFFTELGCEEVGFNIEQTMGVNAPAPLERALVAQFWRELFDAWKALPTIKVRELSYALGTLAEFEGGDVERQIDLIPSVAHDGSVVFLSPEFLDAKSAIYGDFVAGNVMHNSLQELADRALSLRYVADFLTGIATCADNCEYFGACIGGDAASKFFELGSTAGTETASCRHSEQALMDAIVSAI